MGGGASVWGTSVLNLLQRDERGGRVEQGERRRRLPGALSGLSGTGAEAQWEVDDQRRRLLTVSRGKGRKLCMYLSV